MDTRLVLFRDFMDLNSVSVYKNANIKELSQNRGKLASWFVSKALFLYETFAVTFSRVAHKILLTGYLGSPTFAQHYYGRKYAKKGKN